MPLAPEAWGTWGSAVGQAGAKGLVCGATACPRTQGRRRASYWLRQLPLTEKHSDWVREPGPANPHFGPPSVFSARGDRAGPRLHGAQGGSHGWVSRDGAPWGAQGPPSASTPRGLVAVVPTSRDTGRETFLHSEAADRAGSPSSRNRRLQAGAVGQAHRAQWRPTAPKALPVTGGGLGGGCGRHPPCQAGAEPTPPADPMGGGVAALVLSIYNAQALMIAVPLDTFLGRGGGPWGQADFV